MTAAENVSPAEDNDGLRRSVRLLLLLSRVEFSDAQKRIIAGEILSFNEWQLFTGLAVRHGVAALVWQNFSDLGYAGEVPVSERTLLEGLRFKSVARVSWITEAAAGVTSLLEKEGIKVVLLKGLALEHTVYGSRGLRQMSDADILVSPADALRARDILIREGFRSMPLKSPLYRHIILDLGNHLPELHRGGVSVDLHHRLFGPEGEEMVVRAIRDSLIISGANSEAGGAAGQGREPGGSAGAGNSRVITETAGASPNRVITETAGRSFRVLPPMTAFLALVSHIYKHEIKGEFQLRLWTDIYLLLDRYGGEILNDHLPSGAEEAGIADETRVVLTVMEQVWGVAVPQGMTLHAAAAEATVTGFMTRLAHPWTARSLSQREMFLRNLRALRSRRKKLIFILGDIFPSVGFMKKRYGCRTWLTAFLFYPHRLGKIPWILGLLKSNNYDN